MSKIIIDKLHDALLPLVNDKTTPEQLRGAITSVINGNPIAWTSLTAENKALLQKGVRGKPLFNE